MKEIEDIVNEGLKNIDKIEKIKWPIRGYLTKEIFVKNMISAIINNMLDIDFYTLFHYSCKENFNKAINKIIPNIKDEKNNRYKNWKELILKYANKSQDYNTGDIVEYSNTFDKVLTDNPSRRELFNYLFDMLEYLNIPKYTKMYNRKTIIESMIQTEHSPHDYMKKDIISFNQSVSNVFRKIIIFKNATTWQIFFLRIINYKYCNTCGDTKHFNEFTKDKYNSDGKKSKCKSCVYTLSTSVETRENNKIRRMKRTKFLYTYLCPKYELNVPKVDNFAMLEIHHIDGRNDTDLDDIKRVSLQDMEAYVVKNKHRIEILTKNDHMLKHATSGGESFSGVHAALGILGYKYECTVCGTSESLQLHHEDEDKELSFRDMSGYISETIIEQSKLEKEMKKNVIILCGNHHREHEFPYYSYDNIMKIDITDYIREVEI